MKNKRNLYSLKSHCFWLRLCLWVMRLCDWMRGGARTEQLQHVRWLSAHYHWTLALLVYSKCMWEITLRSTTCAMTMATWRMEAPSLRRWCSRSVCWAISWHCSCWKSGAGRPTGPITRSWSLRSSWRTCLAPCLSALLCWPLIFATKHWWRWVRTKRCVPTLASVWPSWAYPHWASYA